MNNTIVFLLLALLPGPLLAQVPVGAWRDHLPYSHCIKVVISEKKIVVATDYNLFTYNTSDNSLEKLSKITGLSDMGIGTMEYNPEKKLLLVAYANGNLDIIKGTVISNIADIKKKSMTGSKKANHIFFNGNYAYLSFSFGIVVVDLERLEIKDTYMIGEAGTSYEVLSVTADNASLYAATTKGIFKADLNDPFLVDFSRWHRITEIPNNTGKFDKLVLFQEKLIANYFGDAENTDVLYIYDNNTWKPLFPDIKEHKNELRVWGNWLTISGSNHGYTINQNLELTDTYATYGFDIAKPHSSLLDEVGNLWIADDRLGLVNRQAGTSQYAGIYPKGPASNHVRDMLWSNGTLYVTGGGTTTRLAPLYLKGELFMFSNESWQSFRNENAYDYTAVVADPLDAQKVYVGSWGNGVFVYQNNQVSDHYTDLNSTLRTNIPGESSFCIGGITFDSDHNLWVAQGGVSAPISIRKPNGNWTSLSWGAYLGTSALGNILIDRYNHFWIPLPPDHGLAVFDINGTVDNEKDDRFLKFNPVSIIGDLISSVNSIVSDNDGSIWLGTDHGVVLYSNPEKIFDGETAGVQPVISRNDGTNIVDPLLGTETVNCIAVDGANRKWFGTEKSGVYLFSPDGTKQINHFSAENSPLFSNSIKSIAINGKSGEVYFGTDQGIISYRSNATQAGEDFTNVYVFPNPVRENYHGDITITGLIAGCSVKITDISGNLVYETKSLGGQAVWNGNTGGGRRVATGIYLVFCSNDDGSKTYVTKMLVIH
jgi:hypothetical protein